MKKYYLFENNETIGPFELEELKTKNIKADTWICVEFENDWQTASSIPDLAPLLQWQPPKPPTQQTLSPPPPRKSGSSGKKIAIFVGVATALFGGYKGVESYQEKQTEQAEKRRELFKKDSLNTVRMQMEVLRDSLTRERNTLTVEKMELDRNLVVADSVIAKTDELLNTAQTERASIEKFKVLRSKAEKEKDLAKADTKINELRTKFDEVYARKTEIVERIAEIQTKQTSIDAELEKLK